MTHSWKLNKSRKKIPIVAQWRTIHMVTAGTSVNHSLIKFCCSSTFFSAFQMPIEKKTSFNSLQNGDTYKYCTVTIKLTKSLQKINVCKEGIVGTKEKYKYFSILHTIPEHSPRRHLLHSVLAWILITQNLNLEKKMTWSLCKAHFKM